MGTWIPVLVRLEDYPEITALISQREANRHDDEPTAETTVSTSGAPAAQPLSAYDERLGRQLPWSEEDLAKLAQGLTTTTARWTRAMDVCAKAPTRPFSTSEIAELTGMSINEWRDAPRKITRHLKAHYPNVPVYTDGRYQGQQIWPLLPTGVPGSPEVHWAITQEQATRWRKVRQQQEGAN